MKVSDVMCAKDIETATPKTPFKELWKAIFKRKIHALPVVEKSGKLVGIIVEEDLLKQLYPGYGEMMDEFSSVMDFEAMEQKVKELSSLTAESIMSKRVIFTRMETPAMRALSRMMARGVSQLPVLSDNDQVIGIVTKSDVFKGIFLRQLAKEQTAPISQAPIPKAQTTHRKKRKQM